MPPYGFTLSLFSIKHSEFSDFVYVTWKLSLFKIKIKVGKFEDT